MIHISLFYNMIWTTGKIQTVFAAVVDTYTLTDSLHIEHREYCSAREWEGHDFAFTVAISNDTLIQEGVEEIKAQV